MNPKTIDPNKLLKDERYKKLIQRLRSETLKLVIDDRNKAREYVKSSLQKLDPKNLNNEYIELLINEMQKLARIVLRKRTEK